MVHHLQHIADLAQICRMHKVKHIVASPGSRNAPLINLFAENPFFQVHSIVDERVAAFYALGIALKNQQIVALVCTSGSAALNYSPALAEAFYRNTPLIAITADRPPHLIDQQDNQTIRQNNIYNNFIKKSIALEIPQNIKQLKNQNARIDKIFYEANTEIKGPVHINIPIGEPLYLAPPVHSKISTPKHQIKNNTALIDTLLSHWEKSNKTIFLIGQNLPSNKITESLSKISKNHKAVVFAEAISNIKIPEAITALEQLMAYIENHKSKKHEPQLLISTGGHIVSKRLKMWLQKQKNIVHIRISPDSDNIDTYNNISYNTIGNIEQIFEQLSNCSKNPEEEFCMLWKNMYKQSMLVHQQFVSNAAFSDLRAIDSVIKSIDSDTVLHLGNSMSVRYAQLFDLQKFTAVFSNRGVSGIDGSVSTAAGYASQSDKQNVLIVGDLGFVYDSNALWNNQFPNNLKIVIINNAGGGIFSLLPDVSQNKNFENYIETKNRANIQKIAEAFNIQYCRCLNQPDIETEMNKLIKSKNAAILEIITSKFENTDVYKKYFDTLINHNKLTN